MQARADREDKGKTNAEQRKKDRREAFKTLRSELAALESAVTRREEEVEVLGASLVGGSARRHTGF